MGKPSFVAVVVLVVLAIGRPARAMSLCDMLVGIEWCPVFDATVSLPTLRQEIERANALDARAAEGEREMRSLAASGDQAAAAAMLHEVIESKRASAKLRTQAMQLAVEVFQVDTSGMRKLGGRLAYVPSDATGREGGSDDQHDIRLTPAAFRSAGWLGSTLAHESEVHMNRHFAAGKVQVSEEATGMQEIEAYDHEIANAPRFGLSEEEVKDIQSRRRAHYRHLSYENRQRIDDGKYEPSR